MNSLSNYWNTLSRRDQTALLICVVAVALALIWWALVQPSTKAVEQQIVSTRASAESLSRVRNMAQELKQYRMTADPSDAAEVQLSELIDSSLRAGGMNMSSFQPVRDGEVRLRLDDVAYNSFITWLVDMEANHSLVTRELTITPTRASGRVSVSMRLAR
ncbi:type II secretion system protein M [Halioxenophilus aromaticivorans]|uniref:Type II secretion system protein M n=1 Tax=Halioxenophilus aromaticivorans TaxID=1306992 RepID=A0AAV3U5H0_9ALTE